jgi:hypothetical protein
MEEKSYRQIPPPLAKEPGEEHEVVIMDPYDIPILNRIQDSLTEHLVHMPVLPPLLIIERSVCGEIMEKGPDGPVAESVIELLHLLPGEEDGGRVEIGRGDRPEL